MNETKGMDVEEVRKRSMDTDVRSSEPVEKKKKVEIGITSQNDKEKEKEEGSNGSKEPVVKMEQSDKNIMEPVDVKEEDVSNEPCHAVLDDRNTDNPVSDTTSSSVNAAKQTDRDSASSTVIGHTTEKDVGITEYLGSHTESFTAIIKQRYSDFIVNEIDEDGNIVHLKTVTYDAKDYDGEEEKEEMSEDVASILNEADKMAIEKIVTGQNKDATHNITAPDDKDLRTKIHLAIKDSFSQLETKTIDDEQGAKVIQVAWRKGRSRDTNRDEWPKSKKSCRYVRFVLYKENKDTMDAIGLIAKNLRVRESMFQYAGTKDKRAKSTQEITVHRVHPKKLVSLNKVLWNMGLGHFRYVQQPLQLGQLSGNHFAIVLRNVQASRAVVDTALTSLRVNGFINFFGMQRFGTTSIPTHTIGSALLQGEWEKAIDLILAPRNDVPAKDKFQKKWAETRDPSATLDVTPRFCGLERNILEALKRKASSFNALEKLPRNTRLLYLHSYQSLVWNTMVSKRLKHFGHDIVPGDLVMEKNERRKGQDAPSPTVVTEANIKDYAITDVVLPLPGYDVCYPQNQVGEWYRELLTADGLDIDNMKRPQKDYSLPGAYRHLIVTPKDVSWDHQSYNDYTQPLTLSDLDLIQGENLVVCGDSGKLSAVVLRMSLPSSCYATMALREVMRVDTSSFYQTSLNVTS